MTSSGDVTIETQGKLEFKARVATIKSDGDLSIEASGPLKLKGRRLI